MGLVLKKSRERGGSEREEEESLIKGGERDRGLEWREIRERVFLRVTLNMSRNCGLLSD